MDSFVRVVKEELREGSTDDDEILCKGFFLFFNAVLIFKRRKKPTME